MTTQYKLSYHIGFALPYFAMSLSKVLKTLKMFERGSLVWVIPEEPYQLTIFEVEEIVAETNP